ncbi:MAG: hypothetical protein CR960_00455 [Pasteurellales bacterium]|nr:MAG: hypothetical protein CR960_00455 [Pasteurellales bacterium]
MTNQLTFKNTTLSPIVLNGQTYFTSSDLAIMLDYKNSKSVNKIYNANSDEFTDEMTIITDSVINGNIGTTDSVVSKRTANLKYSTRIFNLRGCHLVAMFARTPVAKECRKWILDLCKPLKCVRSCEPIRI